MARRTRGLYKRGNVWWACYKSASGKVIQETTRKTDHGEAVAFLMERRNEVAAGKAPELRKIVNHTFNELAKEYLTWAERQKGYESKAGFVKQLKDTFGDLPLRNFSVGLIEQYQTGRMKRGCRPVKEGETPKGNKPATINRLVETLKHMFTKAVEWEWVEEEAAKRVRKVRLLKENNRRLRYLTVEECQKLLRECSSHLRPIVTMALHTGMRKAEILGLTWDKVDLRNGLILLAQDDTKNSERKEIPIDGTVRATLQGLTRRLDVAYLFYDQETGMRYQDIKKGFNAACRRAGIKDFVFHDLRHTFASHLVMKGIDITTVKELLGHKTLTMTLRYAHLAPSHKARAVDVLDDCLNENSTVQLPYNLGRG